MPYCPDCRTEYRPGFDTCADCNSPLVDFPPDKQDTPPSLKDKVLIIIGQVTAVVIYSAIVAMLTLPLGKLATSKWGTLLILISAPSVMWFAFGWFLCDWFSPILVWICWLTIGVTITAANASTISTFDTLATLIALPIAGALPITCGIYFGKQKRLYLFFVPFLAYAVMFRILIEASN